LIYTRRRTGVAIRPAAPDVGLALTPLAYGGKIATEVVEVAEEVPEVERPIAATYRIGKQAAPTPQRLPSLNSPLRALLANSAVRKLSDLFHPYSECDVLTNGSFATGTTGWEFSEDANYAWSSSALRIRQGTIYQEVEGLTPGNRLRVTFDCSADVQTQLYAYVTPESRDGNSNGYSGLAQDGIIGELYVEPNTVRTFSFDTNPIDDTGTVFLQFTVGDSGEAVVLDNITMCEIEESACGEEDITLARDLFTTGRGGWAGDGTVSGGSITLTDTESISQDFFAQLSSDVIRVNVKLATGSSGVRVTAESLSDPALMADYTGDETTETRQFTFKSLGNSFRITITPFQAIAADLKTVIDEIVVCRTDSEDCTGNVNNVRTLIEWNGTPRSPTNFFNIIARFTFRDPDDPLSTTVVDFLPTGDARTGSVVPTGCGIPSGVNCDFWKQQGNGGAAQANVLGSELPTSTSGIVAGQLATLTNRNNWIWSIPAMGQDQDALYSTWPTIPKLLTESVQFLILTNNVTPALGQPLEETFTVASGYTGDDEQAWEWGTTIPMQSSGNIGGPFTNVRMRVYYWIMPKRFNAHNLAYDQSALISWIEILHLMRARLMIGGTIIGGTDLGTPTGGPGEYEEVVLTTTGYYTSPKDADGVNTAGSVGIYGQHGTSFYPPRALSVEFEWTVPTSALLAEPCTITLGFRSGWWHPNGQWMDEEQLYPDLSPPPPATDFSTVFYPPHWYVYGAELDVNGFNIRATDPVCPPPGCEPDPAQEFTFTFRYTNKFGQQREFDQTFEKNDLRQSSQYYPPSPNQWDAITPLGKGLKGQSARWESVRYVLDAVDGSGLDQCTIPKSSNPRGVGFTRLASLTSRARGGTLGDCDAFIDIEEVTKGAVTNEIQSIILPTPNGGSWGVTITIDGEEVSDNFAWNVEAPSLETALEAFSNIGEGNVSVTGSGTIRDPFLVEFIGLLAGRDIAPIVISLNALRGGASAIVTRVQSGTLNERQQITKESGIRTSLVISFNGETSAPIPYNASLNYMETALEVIVGTDVIVTGNASNRDAAYQGPWTVEFAGDYAADNVPLMTTEIDGYDVVVLGQGGSGVNEIQKVAVVATSGTFNLTVFHPDPSDNPTFGGDYTITGIPYNASAAVLKAALAQVPWVSTNTVVTRLTGLPTDHYEWTVEFRGPNASTAIPLMEADGSDLRGPSIIVAERQKGGGTSERQRVRIYRALSGSYRLTVTIDGVAYTTVNIPWNADESGVEFSLQDLEPFTALPTDIRVRTYAGEDDPDVIAAYDVIFGKRFGDVPIMTGTNLLKCTTFGVRSVQPPPYPWPLEECEEDRIGCSPYPPPCRPAEGDGDDGDGGPCCDITTISDEANVFSQIYLERELFDPYTKLPGTDEVFTVRHLALTKGLSPSLYNAYSRNFTTGKLSALAFTERVKTKMSIVLIEKAVDTAAERSRIEAKIKAAEILPSRFVWDD
jgi:hypothetical protein